MRERAFNDCALSAVATPSMWFLNQIWESWRLSFYKLMLRVWFSLIAICSWIRGFMVQKNVSAALFQTTESWKIYCYQWATSFHRSSCSVIGELVLSLSTLWLPFPSSPPLPSFSSSRLCPPYAPSLFSSSLLSQLSHWLSRPQPPLRVPQHLQTVMQLSYHNIMRLRAPKLKEAIFYSCQFIIEGGPTYSNTSKGSGGKRDGGDGREWLWSERGAEGGGGWGAALHFECFLFFPSQSFSLWYFSLVTRAALKSKSSTHHVPLNILKSNM